MKIRMRTTSAGPTGVLRAGHVYSLGDVEAKQLLAGGYADPVKASDAETADAAPGPETAARKPAAATRGRTSKPKGGDADKDDDQDKDNKNDDE